MDAIWKALGVGAITFRRVRVAEFIEHLSAHVGNELRDSAEVHRRSFWHPGHDILENLCLGLGMPFAVPEH
jgi:hypothetical protein